MATSMLLTGLYAAGVQAAAVVVLVYVVFALMGARVFAAPLAQAPDPTPPPGPHRR
jgi:hypothetical protein